MRNRPLVFLALLLATVPTFADIGTIEITPAATLLFPYFEVDPSNPNGVNTLLTVQNASATAVMVNLTLWTDYGLSTENFNVYLTGFDTQVIDMRNVLNRVPPVTADDGDDPFDTISPQGPISQDINFPGLPQNHSCPDLVQAHTGQPAPDAFGGLCGSFNYGDGIARGYVTADTVNSHTTQKPDDAGYFTAIATFQNVILGDWMIVNPSNGLAIADAAVHIEASLTNPLTDTAGDYTFYARVVGYTAADHREALPVAWAGRYSESRTTIDYWRDPGVPVAPFVCATTPYTLAQRQITAFDANGALTPVAAGNHFPRAEGSTPVSPGGLGLTPPLGWVFLNLNLPAPSGPLGFIRQSWVTFRSIPRSLGTGSLLRYTVPGIQLGNASTGDNPSIP